MIAGLLWTVEVARHKRWEGLDGRLDHLDDCIDSVRTVVLTKGVTREELASFRLEIEETMTRMRSAVSQDTNGLHQRLMRIEQPFFDRTS